MLEESLTIEVNGHTSPRRVPCLITYISPFRIITSQYISPWETSLEEVNYNNWDYIKLHEIAGGIDLKPEKPYYMLISRDGGLAIPAVKEFQNQQKAIDFFNRSLAAILLGGIYCEAINADHLDMGSIIDWKYIRSHHSGSAAPNLFHPKNTT